MFIDVRTNEIEKISLDDLRQMKISLETPGEHVLWVDIENPTEQDMKVVETKFGLHPLTTEDILNFSTGIIITAYVSPCKTPERKQNLSKTTCL
jgi:Mg2+ and Co2+ transporter CorA